MLEVGGQDLWGRWSQIPNLPEPLDWDWGFGQISEATRPLSGHPL